MFDVSQIFRQQKKPRARPGSDREGLLVVGQSTTNCCRFELLTACKQLTTKCSQLGMNRTVFSYVSTKLPLDEGLCFMRPGQIL